MKNGKKCLAIARSFLDLQSLKTPSGHEVFSNSPIEKNTNSCQAFSRLIIIENAWHPLCTFKINNCIKQLVAAKHFLDQQLQKTIGDC
jgi:hypothetical protein